MAAGSAPAPRGEDQCGSPCLIVYGSGSDSEELAHKIGEQCRELGIRSRARAIDDRHDADLARFPSMVAVLPTFSDNLKIRTSLEPFAGLIADYRLRWPEGLGHVRAGVDPLDVGVAYLVGERVLVHHSTMRSSLRRVCHVHISDQDGPFDLLRPYRTPATPPPAAPWDEPTDVVASTVQETWSYIKQWGVADPTSIAQLLQCIRRCRNHFEDPKKPQLYRPHRDLARNRLDLILDGPDAQMGDSKTWSENGARVWRYVLQQLQLIEPAIRRPAKANARDAQKDLRRLYNSMRVIDAFQRAASSRRFE